MTNKRRHILTGETTLDGKLHWNLQRSLAMPEDDEAFLVEFPYYKDYTEDKAQKELAERLKNNGIQWLYRKKKRWFIDMPKLLFFIPNVTDFRWLQGVFEVVPHIIRREDRNGDIIKFVITEEYMREITPKRIFLSHNGADKNMIREYHQTLKILGFEPWLDEEAMVAGANLERALLEGMKNSCAAIFFLTQNYRDTAYLASEIDYAIAEKRRKGDRFSIITLVLGDRTIEVPDLLKTYTWKTPKGELEAIREIIRALPLELPPPTWKQFSD